MPTALGRHTSVRSPADYARVSAEALGRGQAEHDPALVGGVTDTGAVPADDGGT